jgi:hypothetical protein
MREITYYIYYKGRITRTAKTNHDVRLYIEEKLNGYGQKIKDFMVYRSDGVHRDRLMLEASPIWAVSVGGC